MDNNKHLEIKVSKKDFGKEILKTLIILCTLSIIAFVFFQTGYKHGKVDMCQEQLGMRYLTNDECITMIEYDLIMQKQEALVDSMDPFSGMNYDQIEELRKDYEQEVNKIGEKYE